MNQLVEKMEYVQKYIKLRKNVDVTIVLRSHHDLSKLEFAYQFAKNYMEENKKSFDD
jgi:hypothetical protein